MAEPALPNRSCVSLHPVAGVPAPVLEFWNRAQATQDPYRGITASPAWYAMMAEQMDPGARLVTIGSLAGPLCAVIPLLASTWTVEVNPGGRVLLRRTVKVIRVCGGDLVEHGAAPADLLAALRQVFAAYPDADAILFDRLECGPRSKLLQQSVAGAHGLRLVEGGVRMPHYRLILPPTLEGFRTLRSEETIRKIDRRERALAREAGGDVRVVEIRTPEDITPLEASIESMMNRTWQAERLGHRFSVASMQDIARRGWLRSFALVTGAGPVAFALCYQGMGVLVYEHIGYDPRFARHSPGTLLLHRLIERLYHADTPTCVDFGEGEGEYKRLLSNHRVEVQAFAVVRSCRPVAWLLAMAGAARDLNAFGRRCRDHRYVRNLRRMMARGKAGQP
jgi:hypothetical protein